jgi:predicted permease
MFWSDVKHAGRSVWRRRTTFAALAVLTAGGVTASTALFSIVDGALFKPLPFRDPDRLVAVGSSIPATASRPGPLSLDDMSSLSQAGILVTAHYVRVTNSEHFDQPASVSAVASVSSSFFDVLGVRPYRGRLLMPVDVDSSPRSMVLAYGEWLRQFGGDEGVIGGVVLYQGERVRVVGVAPEGVGFPAGAAAWTTLAPARTQAQREFAHLEAIGRLPDGVSIEAVASRLPSLRFQGLREYVRPGGTNGLLLLLVVTLLMLVVTWVQVAALQLAHTPQTQHEMRVRSALGASRRDLLGNRLAEGLWLATSAFVLAAVSVPPATAMIAARLPPQLTRGMPVGTDIRVLLFALALTITGVAILAVAPFWKSGGGGLAALRGARGVGAGLRGRQLLVTAQVLVTAPLLYLAGLTVRSDAALHRVEMGFALDRVFTVRLPGTLVGGVSETMLTDRRSVIDAVRQLPGVVAASGTTELPFGGTTRGVVTLGTQRGDPSLPVVRLVVEPKYFSTLKIPVVKGREFEIGDGRDRPLVAIVSAQVAAAMVGQSRDALSSVLIDGLLVHVVGVAADVRDRHPAIAPEPRVYLPTGQWIPPSYLVARLGSGPAAAGAEALAARLRQAWPAHAPPPTLIGYEALLAEAVSDVSGRAALLGIASAIALVMTLVGVWGSVATSIQQRAPENAVRLVCGAEPWQISLAELRIVLRSVALGGVVGVLLGVATARLTGALFFGVSAMDGLTVQLVLGALVVVATLSALWPALRVSHLDPARTLREQ